MNQGFANNFEDDMSIQWFPGHMHKAQKEMRERLPQIDMIIELLDARLPASSENPLLAEIRGDKPCLKLLNKADLADTAATDTWLEHFRQRDQTDALALTAHTLDNSESILQRCRLLCPGREGAGKELKILIGGIPNVGKSTLINKLAGRLIAKTGNEPAITKGQQRIALQHGLALYDTPGILWPKVENPHSGYRLAVSGAIRDTAIDHGDVALYATNWLMRDYPQALCTRFALDPLPADDIGVLEAIGEKRGNLRVGGQVDFDKVGRLLLSEIRRGELGPVTLELPAQVAKEQQEAEQQAAIKAAKKAERLARHKKKRR